MAVENPVPENSRVVGEMILAEFDATDKSVADFKINTIRSYFPQIVSDAERLVTTFDEEYPDGEIGEWYDATPTFADELAFAADVHSHSGEPFENDPDVNMSKSVNSPYREFYRGIFARYFTPMLNWWSSHPNADLEANPESYRKSLFLTAYDIVRSQNPYPADIEPNSDKTPQQVT